jgi:hypothetical protein
MRPIGIPGTLSHRSSSRGAAVYPRDGALARIHERGLLAATRTIGGWRPERCLIQTSGPYALSLFTDSAIGRFRNA